jgi:23S rRNA (cytosine1962-C5)-methyltransferase
MIHLCADELLFTRLESAWELRQTLFPDPEHTTGYRLINGEGDGLPGLVCDIYADVAVLKLDGPGVWSVHLSKKRRNSVLLIRM